jgi:hypothetical protein
LYNVVAIYNVRFRWVFPVVQLSLDGRLLPADLLQTCRWRDITRADRPTYTLDPHPSVVTGRFVASQIVSIGHFAAL